MRIHKKSGDLSVTAISGTYVVTLGFNLDESKINDLLGFAIHRTDHTENENYWLKGFKTFEETEPNPVPGALYSTLEHPIQSFQWADYTAKPDHRYTYKVVPLTGSPKNMKQSPPVEVEVQTEAEYSGEHAIYFNSGVAGSQAYYREFGDKKPDDVPNQEAFKWLSRGLEEAILGVIDRANGSDYGLRASVYEFNHYPVLEAFRRAADAGADVKIVYDSRQDNPKLANDEAIEWTGIRDLVIRRTRPKSYISHNKFIVLLKNGKPIEVWTGSTNITKGGIFGQANVGHLIRNEQIAKKYYDYWVQLSGDPTNPDLKKWTEKETPDPADQPYPPNTITPLFSPRKTLKVLEWYAKRMDEAEETVCLTSAFGVNFRLSEIFAKDKTYLRYVLLEKKANNYEEFSQDPDVLISVGSHLEDATYKWTREVLTDYNFHVKYIHTKFMLIDPLSDNPTVITGSANFSDQSTTDNDENMLVIQGNKRVADIYLGEFFRLFNHFYFRYVVNAQKAAEGSEEKKKSYLKPDSSWASKYYVHGSIKEKQRLLFSKDLS
jgi:phosphatidylserine/phosphatidylglycerophosphate/cardiolipin synthase-like enzyme